MQSTRKESRTYNAVVLEENVQQMLRKWKAELNEPSPASSLLLLGEEEDNATNALAAPKPDPDAKNHDVDAA
ncbi:hypothetical protein CQW23_12341 [Capsicum baccatum]|uniref:Uncharacterized protein n=1 Tax=Capsicum baccatum TaxID=33114 RepID=A0A2G2WSB7_CAPBA|nr:hypothetical protein CQW23_12341 [Capsicum baccatum]